MDDHPKKLSTDINNQNSPMNVGNDVNFDDSISKYCSLVSNILNQSKECVNSYINDKNINDLTMNDYLNVMAELFSKLNIDYKESTCKNLLQGFMNHNLSEVYEKEFPSTDETPNYPLTFDQFRTIITEVYKENNIEYDENICIKVFESLKKGGMKEYLKYIDSLKLPFNFK